MLVEITEKEWYKVLRKRKNITLKTLAEALGVTPTTLSMYEDNKRDLSSKRENMYKEFINNAQ